MADLADDRLGPTTATATAGDAWAMRWNARMAWSAFVHLLHALLVLVLLLFVPGRAAVYLKFVWGIGALFSILGLLLVLRVGSYEGISEDEVGQLIRRCYWCATGTYLGLLGFSLYSLLRH